MRIVSRFAEPVSNVKVHDKFFHSFLLPGLALRFAHADATCGPSWSHNRNGKPMGAVLTDMTDPSQLAAIVPNHRVDGVSHVEIFGPPPLLEGESQETYDTLLARVTGAVNPKDIIEEIWVHDIVDLVWEILRLRRLKIALLSSSVGRGLRKLYNDRVEYSTSSLIARWSAREPAAVKKIEQFPKAHGLTMDAVMAHSLVACLDEIERIDIAISRAESRRNAAQREIERRRSIFGQSLQRAVQQVEHDAVVPVEGAG